MKKLLATMEMLDKCGFYRLADMFEKEMFKVAAWPYNMSALDELPYSARNVKWDRNKEDYKQYDDIFWKELKQRIPEYQQLNIDPDEKNNLEGEMHGDDPVPGPAFTWPDEGGVSPSMNGSLDSFTWDESHDSNIGPDYWKNLQPKR
jgi:hypothetical protein